MIETTAYRYTITVTYIDNVNEAFNPSIFGYQFIDRQYVTDSKLWKLELHDVFNDMFKKYHCVACMVRVVDNYGFNDEWRDVVIDYRVQQHDNKFYFIEF